MKITTIEIQAIIEKMKYNKCMTRATLLKNLRGKSIDYFKKEAKKLGFRIIETEGFKPQIKNGKHYTGTYYKYSVEKINKRNEYPCGFSKTFLACPLDGKYSSACRSCPIKPTIKRRGKLAGYDYNTDKLY